MEANRLMQTNVLIKPIVLKRGENTDFPTHPVRHTTRLIIENKNLSQAGCFSLWHLFSENLTAAMAQNIIEPRLRR
jgi:hypothetical protein